MKTQPDLNYKLQRLFYDIHNSLGEETFLKFLSELYKEQLYDLEVEIENYDYIEYKDYIKKLKKNRGKLIKLIKDFEKFAKQKIDLGTLYEDKND